ncbi:hypothetical protein HK101_010273, partial [Irineochytrium annulatum]
MASLTESDRNVVADAVAAKGAGEVLASTVARLYFANQEQWEYQRKCGAVALAKDGRDFSFQMVDLT